MSGSILAGEAALSDCGVIAGQHRRFPFSIRTETWNAVLLAVQHLIDKITTGTLVQKKQQSP